MHKNVCLSHEMNPALFFGLWIPIAVIGSIGGVKAIPIVHELLSTTAMAVTFGNRMGVGSVAEFWNALCFFLWVVLMLVSLTLPFAGLLFGGPAIAWIHKRFVEKSPKTPWHR